MRRRHDRRSEARWKGFRQFPTFPFGTDRDWGAHPGSMARESSVQELGNSAVFQFELADEPVVMPNPSDRMDDQVAAEQNQRGAQQKERYQQMHDLENIIIARCRDQNAEDRKRQG